MSQLLRFLKTFSFKFKEDCLIKQLLFYKFEVMCMHKYGSVY